MNTLAVRQGHGRGRPSVQRANSNDKAILGAAAELFLRDGYDAVTMEAIANATPLSKTTLYSRFASKEILLMAVIRDRMDTWSAGSAEQDYLIADDMEGRLLYHARSLTQYMRAPEVKGFVRLAYVLAERFPEISRTMYDEGYVYVVNFVRDDIIEIAKRDGRTVVDAQSVAKCFVSAVIGWNMQEAGRGGGTDDEADAAAARFAQLFWAARDYW